MDRTSKHKQYRLDVNIGRNIHKGKRSYQGTLPGGIPFL